MSSDLAELLDVQILASLQGLVVDRFFHIEFFMAGLVFDFQLDPFLVN